MVFVWGSSGPNAAAESSAQPPRGMPDLERTEGDPLCTADGQKVVYLERVCVHHPICSACAGVPGSLQHGLMQPPELRNCLMHCSPTTGSCHMAGEAQCC
jgi:hypothetical protein